MRALQVVAVAVLTVAGARLAPAQDGVTFVEPAGVLVMPFDVTANRVSNQIVSRTGSGPGAPSLQTHWVFWAADCRHLADVVIFLTDRDTVVVDPTRLQGQIQTQNPSENRPVGPLIDLAGERGFVTVTALDAAGAVVPQLVGAWTIADLGTGAGFGSDAVGVSRDGTLGDPAVLAGGITLTTFNPQLLGASAVILIGVESDGSRVGPIERGSDALGGAHVCCTASVTDNLEVSASLPDVCIACAGFAPIAGAGGLIPPTTVLTSAGIVQLRGCRSADRDGSLVALGEGDQAQFLLAFHAQAVGPFGLVVTGKYAAPVK